MFRLACLLGKSLDEIEDMPVRDLTLWRYWMAEPRGELRMDYQTASVVQAIYGIMSGFSKSKPPKINECLLKFATQDNTEEQKKLNIARSMMSLQALMGKNQNLAGRIKDVIGLDGTKSDTKS